MDTNETNKLKLDNLLKQADEAHEQHQYALSIRLYLEANEIANNLSDVPPLQKAEIAHDIGKIYFYQGDYGVAHKYFEIALLAKQKHLAPDALKLADIYNEVALTELCLGHLEKALQHLDDALSIRYKHHSDKHPKILDTQLNKAVVLQHLNRLDEAIQICESIIDDYPADHVNLGELHNNVGLLYHKQEQYDKALKHHMISLTIKQNKPTNTYNLAEVANSYYHIARCHAKLNNLTLLN